MKSTKQNMSSESKAKAAPAQAFVEASIREGFSLEDVKMWQNLCRDVSVLKEDSEETMHGMLSICDKEGISPLAVCGEMRGMGFKSCTAGIQPALEHYFNKEVDADDEKPEWSDEETEKHVEKSRKKYVEEFSQVEDF